MRKSAILAVIGPVLALAACGENSGWNPNYSAIDNGSDYAEYLRSREMALQGKGAVPAVIPVALPAESPRVVHTKRQTGAVQVTATAVPANAQVATTGPYPGSTPVLVRYAHQETQAPGTRKYQRNGGGSDAAACRKYDGSDRAQVAFLAAGGPVIDPHGMDPDGDGFVCGWDPAPFRQPRI